MLPKNLALQLMEFREVLVTITGKPSQDDIVCIRKAINPILLQAGYNKAHAKHNLWGITSQYNVHATKYGEDVVMTKRIGIYPPVSQDAINQTQKLDSV